jgi:hypothetical protein
MQVLYDALFYISKVTHVVASAQVLYDQSFFSKVILARVE